ncbi:hypothetical protein N646_4544 [Vibrio alginolyticus NBRC 15630 = ATCC 17749]|uniref:Uncharacterized protein n=1 Tax=Vibrio alginolyticus (strain ATCC 17749 / DSM 2171 / NBRC 15630 / NCIMB 1903 / NCTC 12160 / XII-53) TaxID=1219076 RepID=A0A2I3CS32_VIBAX|nr:hypothetical protein N646_4544 [Vibrio alginolyticus NBRC 15630 = ATCC 17749]
MCAWTSKARSKFLQAYPFTIVQGLLVTVLFALTKYLYQHFET